MKTLNIVVTENCELCDKGIRKLNILRYFFKIQEVDVQNGYQEYLLRVPVVLYKDKILDEEIINKIKILRNYIKYPVKVSTLLPKIFKPLRGKNDGILLEIKLNWDKIVEPSISSICFVYSPCSLVCGGVV